MNELKFKNKKVCRVCLYPIVFYKDAYYKKGANGQSYPLNIHYVDCANKVFVEGPVSYTHLTLPTTPYV